MSKRAFHIRTFQLDDLAQIQDLQDRYSKRFPGALSTPVEIYSSPGFAGGANIFCAFESSGRMAGLASLLPELNLDGSPHSPHLIRADIKVDPGAQEPEALSEALLGCVLERSMDLVEASPRISTQVVFQYFPFEGPIIDFLFRSGFVHTESVFHMKRDLTLAVPTVLEPPGMKTLHWRMGTEVEQRLYVQARNQCFPEAPMTLEDWCDFMGSAQWQAGTCLAVFDGEDLAGSITLFWDEERNRINEQLIGSTEYLFVLPRWRGLGLGRYLLAQGLNHLRKHGLLEAELEVRAANESALGIYTQIGYRVDRESVFLVDTLSDLILAGR